MKKYHGWDLLRGIAAFGIVGCHLGLSQRTTGGEWVTALCNFNVGLFAAISGFLMDLRGRDYIQKRARRILPTYFIWSLIYVVATGMFDLVFDGGRLNERFYSVSNWLQILFCGSAGAHLWFLVCLFYAQIMLFGINIAMEGLKLQDGTKKMVLGVMSIALLFCSVLDSNWYCLYPIRLMSFLMLGYVLKDLVRTDVFFLPLAGAMFMLAVHLGAHGFLPGFIRDYLLAIPVMLLFVSNRFHEGKVASLLAVTSMGVYLVHPLFARGASFAVVKLIEPPFGAMVVLGEWLAIWLVSFAVIVCIQRSTVLARLVR